jgi:hypothetical protein
VKFTCERCGKKYATAESPAPGRVYKLKCKACGHLIVVRSSAAAPSEVPLEVGAPEPHHDAAAPTPTPTPLAALSSSGTQEIPVPAAHSAATPPEDLRPPAAEGGYVDLFADAPKAEAEPPRPPPPPPPPPPREDPFIAATRASLPDGFGAGTKTPDPFAPMQIEPPAADIGATPEPRPVATRTPPPMPKVPVIPKAPQQRSALPLVLMGAGGLVLVGILAFVLLGKGPAPAPPAPVAKAPAPAPAAPRPPPAAVAQPVAPPPVPVAVTPPAPPAPSADDERIAREAQRERDRAAKEAREREAREAQREREREKATREARARDERERDAKARDQRARDEREAKEREEREAEDARDLELRDRQRRERERLAALAASTPEGEGLDQAAIDKVLHSARKLFDDCISTTAPAGQVRLDGRRVTLGLNIQGTGAVTYPTLDDVTLNGTELGSCLKNAAKNIVFPKFRGDPVRVEVPIVLASRR